MYVRKKSIVGLAAALVLVGILSINSCQQEQVLSMNPNDIDFTKIPYPNISDYGFFIGDLSELLPNDGVLLYKPSSTLFSDYSEKSRFVWMAAGTSGSIMEDDWQQIDFPDKAVLIKNFYYDDVGGEKHVVETRLLVKDDGKWNAYPYLWNDEQSDAVYKMTGANLPLSFTHGGTDHDIVYVQPNKNQCKSCHNQNEELKPIGPKARNLNYELDYGNGEFKNQLAKWQEMGYLNNFTKSSNYQAVPDYTHTDIDLESRARAYLDANCAYCHNPASPASTSGLTLTYEETDTSKLGYYKTPVAAGLGAGTLQIDIHPGKADSSILVYRMSSTDQGVAMPELGRVMVHEEGVQLISDWINNMR